MSYYITNPPLQRGYQYAANTEALGPLDAQTIAVTNEAIGKKTNPDYESGRKYTPVQKQKYIAFTLAVVATITAVGLLCLGASTTLAPLLLLGVLLGVSAVGLVVYGLTRQDLDSPEERKNIIGKIAQDAFCQTAKAQKSDDVVGYALLDGITPSSTINPEIRAEFYTRYQKLHAEFERFTSWKTAQEKVVESSWSTGTSTLRGWYYNTTSDIQYHIDGIKCKQAVDHATIRHVERRTHQMQTGMRVLNTVSHVLEGMTLVQLENRLWQVNNEYQQQIAPWNSWKANELATIHSLSQRVSNQLDEQFGQIKANAMIPYAENAPAYEPPSPAYHEEEEVKKTVNWY